MSESAWTSIAFTLDGAPAVVECDPRTPALAILREILGAHALKGGCDPQGMCGCCAILVDGRPRLACTLPMRGVIGAVVQTAAGLASAPRAALAEAFAAAGASQCGYCTPGIVVSAAALLARDPTPGDAAIDRALALHLCRCTGYAPIVGAIHAAAERLRGETTLAGMPMADEDLDLATGERAFVEDLVRPGMLHGAVVFAEVAGRVEGLPVCGEAGLVEVALVAAGEEVGAGHPLLAVAHAEPERARQAARRLQALFAQAQAPSVEVGDAILGAEGVPPSATPPPAVATHVVQGERGGVGLTLAVVRRLDGDVDRALARLPNVASVTMTSGPSVAAPLEPDAALAVPLAGGDLLVYSPGHDADGEARALTAALGHPVHVILVPSGGSFGGREAPGVQEAAARLARASGRPVRVTVSHLDATRMAPRRPGAEVVARAGVDGEGRLAALDVEVVLDGGSEAYAVDRLLVELVEGIGYAPPDFRIVARVVASEGPRTAPIRGAGLGVTLAAVEQAIDGACARAGVDAAEARAGALPAAGRRALTALLGACAGGGDAVLAVGPAAGVDRGPPGPTRALAIVRGTRPGGARVYLRLEADGQIEVQCNVPDVGQGHDHVLVRVLAATTGLGAARFHVAWADSRVVGSGAPPHTPVDRAAAAAGRAFAALLAVGAPVAGGAAAAAWTVGEDDGAGEVGWVAAAAELGADGRIARIVTIGSPAPGGTDASAACAVLGGAHAGVGLALADITGADLRIRSLGVMKLRATPRIEVHAAPGVSVGDADLGGLACSATAAALAVAVAAHETAPRSAFPMRDSAAATSAGVRATRAE